MRATARGHVAALRDGLGEIDALLARAPQTDLDRAMQRDLADALGMFIDRIGAVMPVTFAPPAPDRGSTPDAS